ncbi:MAG: thioredoxin family protein, partial [Thermoguttaceae bacterium]|nr:thioredoxin family protein [Thermoguttaceae bacterium]
MERRQTKRRTWARVGGVLLSAATLAGAAATTPIWAETNGGNALSAAPSTNAFAARLVVLEFASKTDADAELTNALLNAMRCKNYPIQRVERENGGAALFERFAVSATPTFVLLVDGKEVDRVATPGTPSAAILRNQLLRLFDRGREELAAKTLGETKKKEKSRVTRAQADGDSAGFAVSGASAASVATPVQPSLPSNVSSVAATSAAPISASATVSKSAPNPISLASA